MSGPTPTNTTGDVPGEPATSPLALDWDGLEGQLAEDSRAYLEAVANAAVSELFAGDVAGQAVLLTGQGPFDVRLGELAEKLGAEVFYAEEDEFIWENIDLVVLGYANFWEELLMESLEHDHLEYMAQEEFLAELLFAQPPDYVEGDERIARHAGLSFLASIGFEWPSTYAEPGDGSGEERERDEMSWLRAEYGYSAASYIPVGRRREALDAAVQGRGLEATADFLAWLARSRKRTGQRRLRRAIERYERDLAWLKARYYDNSPHTFHWPSTDWS